MDHTEQAQSQAPGQAQARRTAPVTGGQSHQPFDQAEALPTLGGHPHGKVSSWVLTGVVVAACVAGGAALILHLWWLFWVCVGVTVLSIPAGKVIRIMDDTVMWGGTETAQHETAQQEPDGGPRRLES